MRHDMHKVLTERPRGGGRIRSGPRNRTERGEYLEPYGVFDDLRRPKLSCRRPHKERNREKQFSDLLGPLRRYLQSQVGRSWNAVWSDICTVLRGNGLQANHVKGHIQSAVGGIPFSGQPYFWGSIGEPRSRGYGHLYVNLAGILCQDKRKARKRRK